MSQVSAHGKSGECAKQQAPTLPDPRRIGVLRDTVDQPCRSPRQQQIETGGSQGQYNSKTEEAATPQPHAGDKGEHLTVGENRWLPVHFITFPHSA
ncbi:hypothetical protein D3C87_1981040 [compost metagenome]